MTDGNFGLIHSKYLKTPGNPYFRWISKKGGWEKGLQMFGNFLFNACYFFQFVFAMSLEAADFMSFTSTLSGARVSERDSIESSSDSD
ncbi:hypothetical protein TrST_g10335 [Triparma strigata]|uniref:Uncharacterized protein n=1 Tax=Triparma strigata TaxID=1606541 RepID=A0A9W7AVP9_9STRA|nr:hypothetical protein TrST_g10335 [Triparma strigata]